MKNKNSLFILFLFSILMAGCKNITTQCSDSKITIENRWYEENNGINNLEVKENKDILFICNRIKHFPEGKEIRIAYSYGDIDIYLNNRKFQAIFTYRNGVVYRIEPGRYVHDEELTARIIKIMEIKKRCWGKDCE